MTFKVPLYVTPLLSYDSSNFKDQHIKTKQFQKNAIEIKQPKQDLRKVGEKRSINVGKKTINRVNNISIDSLFTGE